MFTDGTKENIESRNLLASPHEKTNPAAAGFVPAVREPAEAIDAQRQAAAQIAALKAQKEAAEAATAVELQKSSALKVRVRDVPKDGSQ